MFLTTSPPPAPSFFLHNSPAISVCYFSFPCDASCSCCAILFLLFFLIPWLQIFIAGCWALTSWSPLRSTSGSTTSRKTRCQACSVEWVPCTRLCSFVSETCLVVSLLWPKVHSYNADRQMAIAIAALMVKSGMGLEKSSLKEMAVSVDVVAGLLLRTLSDCDKVEAACHFYCIVDVL